MKPVWAGGWTFSRWIFTVAQLLEMMRQFRQVLDSYRHPTFNFGTGLLHFSDAVLFPAPVGWLCWGLGALGLVGLGKGGRWARPGLLLWMAAELALFGGLGWEINAPERIMGWVAVGFLLGPINGPVQQSCSPVARWFFMLWMSGMYAMAGWMKALEESGWWDGSILAQALADPIMGGTSLGIWMSGIPWIPRFLGFFTLAFELSFGVFVWFAETNPWILLAGILFHLGVQGLMSVGTLGLTVLGCYPILLDPARAEAAWDWLEPRIRSRIFSRASSRRFG